MHPHLRSWSRFTPGFIAVLLGLGVSSEAAAQTTCPIAAVCTPGNATSGQANLFGMGILNVTVGNNLINNTTGNYIDGYRDYGCTSNAALNVGQTYTISVRTGPNTNENVKVWIDYNNDGAFTGNSELVFDGPNSIVHTGTFAPPTTAVLSTNLRMRVASDYALGIVPTSCSTPQYSQVEDYSVRLSSNVSAPVAVFTTNGTTTCSGTVQFTDASQNLPTSWLWTFGDGTTSTLQSPSHTYTTAGTYAVTLRATNTVGSTTSAATTITYNASVPLAASCSPQTTNYFANYGITRFRLGDIDNTSADGSAGYQDFTCPQRTDLIVGVNNPMIITTGGVNPHDIRVYLDVNNNGVFAASELVYTGLNTASPGATTTFTLPTGTVLNQPLRLRVIADAIGNTAGPCVNPVSGQVEDYTIIARPNTLPPIINFSTNYVVGGCVNPIQFTDLTTNVPISWLWSFGDGTTSTLQNPTHTYTASGTYNITLSATNANASASVTRLNAVTIQVPCLTYCASNGTGGTGPGGQQLPSPFFIATVGIANATPAFVNNSSVATGGYANYTSLTLSASVGNSLSLTVGTNLAAQHRTSAWVDWNMNGTFDASELVVNGTANANTFTAPFTVPAGMAGSTPRMRVMVVANATGGTPNPCATNLINAEVEDYQLRILPLATRDAQALPTLSLFPNPTLDGRVSLRLPDASAAGLYTTEVQNLLGATVLRTALRLGPAADAQLDLSALPAGVYVLRLRDAQGQTALRRVVRE
ncbi:GEVED domain-containing protein [Hymenobacter artigasi]|uniref:GEVED domain-containing protein n=1 Tax=Hymenobacter artigasi TaxID=2719616 RepID=UPI001B2FEB93